jgi:hypothetical protein
MVPTAWGKSHFQDGSHGRITASLRGITTALGLLRYRGIEEAVCFAGRREDGRGQGIFQQGVLEAALPAATPGSGLKVLTGVPEDGNQDRQGGLSLARPSRPDGVDEPVP